MHLRAVLRQSEESTVGFCNEAAESVGRRGSERRSLTLSALTSSPAAGELPVVLLDISLGGLLMKAETAELSVGDEIDIELPERGLVKTRVAWANAPVFGCQFYERVAPAAISAALLRADPQKADEVAIAAQPMSRSHMRLRIGPELNLSAALSLALAAWGLIGLAGYTLVS